MENLGEWARPEIVWFVIGLVLLLLEFALPGLVIFFFGVGAWVVSLVCFITDISLNAQLLIFIITSILLLAILRNRLKTLFSGFSSSRGDMGSTMEEFVGERVLVKEAIPVHGKGRVELHGTDWDAVADEELPAGTSVEIIGKDNIKLKVKKT